MSLQSSSNMVFFSSSRNCLFKRLQDGAGFQNISCSKSISYNTGVSLSWSQAGAMGGFGEDLLWLSHSQLWGPVQALGLRVSLEANLGAWTICLPWLEGALSRPTAWAAFLPGPSWRRQESQDLFLSLAVNCNSFPLKQPLQGQMASDSACANTAQMISNVHTAGAYSRSSRSYELHGIPQGKLMGQSCLLATPVSQSSCCYWKIP